MITRCLVAVVCSIGFYVEDRSALLASGSQTLYLDRPDCNALAGREVLAEISDLRSEPFSSEDRESLDAKFASPEPMFLGPVGPKLRHAIHAVILGSQARDLGLDARDVTDGLQIIATRYASVPPYFVLSRAALHSLWVLGVSDEYFVGLVRDHDQNSKLAELAVEMLSAFPDSGGLALLERVGKELKGQSRSLDMEIQYAVQRGRQVARFLKALRDAKDFDQRLALALKHFTPPSKEFGATLSVNRDWRPFASRRAIISLSEKKPEDVARYIFILTAEGEAGSATEKIKSLESCISEECRAFLEELR